jgi:hypothetical protein
VTTRPGPEFPDGELLTLLDAVCDETATAEQVRRLEDRIRADPAVEALFVQYLGQWANVRRHFARSPAANLLERDRGTSVPVARRPRILPLPWIAAAVAAAAVAAVFVWSRLVGPGPAFTSPGSAAVAPGEDVASASEPTDDSVAVLTQAVDARWDGQGPAVGAPLPRGRLRLAGGLARVEFYGGATVILEGPADLELVSPMRAVCRQGKLRAVVPPAASGFTVDAAGVRLVDLGTEFGVDVPGGGDRDGRAPEVHVFDGRVRLLPAEAAADAGDAPTRELTTGQGVRLPAGGDAEGKTFPAEPARFVSAEQLSARGRTDSAGRLRAWAESVETLRRDPALVVCHGFEPGPEWDRRLRNRASSADGGPGAASGAMSGAGDGVIVGARPAEGRWPGKGALDFKRVSDRVRLDVPGEFRSVTLSAWVRVDAVEHRYAALMMSDGFPEGALHWQIGREGILVLGVQGPGGQGGANYLSDPVFRPSRGRTGLWTHLAAVYDADARRVTHYVDGRPVGGGPLKFEIPLRVGRAELGNWNPADTRGGVPIRNFNGRIDEFLLLSRALTGPEVAALFERGRPGP